MKKIAYSIYSVLVCLISFSLLNCGTKNSSSSSSCNLTANLCSCNLLSTAIKKCIDYEGKSITSAQSDCSSSGGTLSRTSLCATENRVGTCTVGILSDKTHSRYYEDAITNQAACTVSAMGTGFLGVVDWTSN